ncbi:hypothetical protein D3C73_871330 [compost metagenome]
MHFNIILRQILQQDDFLIERALTNESAAEDQRFTLACCLIEGVTGSKDQLVLASQIKGAIAAAYRFRQSADEDACRSLHLQRALKQQGHCGNLVIDPGLLFSHQSQAALLCSFVVQIHRYSVKGSGQLSEFILRYMGLYRSIHGALRDVTGNLQDPAHAAGNIPEYADDQNNR